MASEFMQIVHDGGGPLTNFEACMASPEAEVLPHFFRHPGDSYFAIATQLQPPFDSDQPVRTLSSVNNPAICCPAIWWAHVLICESHRCHDLRRPGPSTRQWQLLHARTPAGPHWLVERMKHWPEDHVHQYGPFWNLLRAGK
jgi:hypothetical protein